MTTTYVALLRGINVAGHTKVKMDRLCSMLCSLGYTGVTTYIQSGNVVFQSPITEVTQLARAIERRLMDETGVATTALVWSGTEFVQVVANNPFVAQQKELSKLHVTFLAEPVTAERAARLVAPTGEPDEFVLFEREVYIYCPNGYGRTKLNNAYFERRLGVAATTRNWRTVTAMRDLVAGP